MLLFSKAVELAGDGFGSSGQIWLVFGLNALFAVAFAAGAYGFWQRFNWGRLLFLWTIVCWTGFNLWALFIPGTSHPVNELLFSSLQTLAGAAISLWYLNMPRIKAFFITKESGNPHWNDSA
jgi:hypothetical protein